MKVLEGLLEVEDDLQPPVIISWLSLFQLQFPIFKWKLRGYAYNYKIFLN
jgi:hypothetical protein